jgi:hypothetical protein
LGEVRDRLATVLQEREYDLILGHSMGGCLMYNLISTGIINSSQKMIFITPLLYSGMMKKLVLSIPFIEYIPLKMSFVFPAYTMSTDFNLANHRPGIITLRQVKYANDHFIDDPNGIVAKLSTCDNLRIIYGEDDMVTQPLPDESLKIFPEGRVHFVPGKHDPFRAFSDTYIFWETFEWLLGDIGY